MSTNPKKVFSERHAGDYNHSFSSLVRELYRLRINSEYLQE